ncbi:MAG: PTS sugar transporter subunit IIB [Lactobacillales bacterium]|jgi:PTS system galactitol-specific IIB component|nr:PTS sugar transporter subunit IIB [Lactobacillales bacterium]
MKRLIVACGSGVATSQTIASKIADKFEQDGIVVTVDAVDYKSIDGELGTTNIYVYIMPPEQELIEKTEELGIDVFPGIPFLTGMGMDEVYEQIVEAAQKS